MTSGVYQLIYCSKNCLEGDSEQKTKEIHQILSSARANNAKAGVTGALLFNAGVFAQVLEGPLAAVERIFERIQQDPRHSDVTVLQSGETATRDFPDWSMAYASTIQDEALPHAIAVFEAAFTDSSAAAEQVLSLLHSVVVQEEEWV